MPKISVISIAKNREELENLAKHLEKQTYQDYEFIYSTKGSIPEAWNDALSHANGEYIVFTESDAYPVYETWLQEIAQHAEKNTIIKGLEANPTDLNLCNLVCDAKLFKEHKFDETYKICEDTELFARMRKNKVPIKTINRFPVIHTPKKMWKKTLTRSFWNGMYYTKIIYSHGLRNIETTNTKNLNQEKIHPISNRFRIIIDNILVLTGLAIGAVYYFIKNIFKGNQP